MVAGKLKFEVPRSHSGDSTRTVTPRAAAASSAASTPVFALVLRFSVSSSIVLVAEWMSARIPACEFTGLQSRYGLVSVGVAVPLLAALARSWWKTASNSAAMLGSSVTTAKSRVVSYV